jgi:hypothetical protein
MHAVVADGDALSRGTPCCTTALRHKDKATSSELLYVHVYACGHLHRAAAGVRHAGVASAASDWTPVCPLFNTYYVEHVALSARSTTMRRACYKAWRVRSPSFCSSTTSLSRGAPLALSAKRRSHRRFAPSVIMHSTSTPTTSTPLKADEARRRGGHGRSKGHATDGACT